MTGVSLWRIQLLSQHSHTKALSTALHVLAMLLDLFPLSFFCSHCLFSLSLHVLFRSFAHVEADMGVLRIRDQILQTQSPVPPTKLHKPVSLFAQTRKRSGDFANPPDGLTHPFILDL